MSFKKTKVGSSESMNSRSFGGAESLKKTMLPGSWCHVHQKPRSDVTATHDTLGMPQINVVKTYGPLPTSFSSYYLEENIGKTAAKMWKFLPPPGIRPLIFQGTGTPALRMKIYVLPHLVKMSIMFIGKIICSPQTQSWTQLPKAVTFSQEFWQQSFKLNEYCQAHIADGNPRILQMAERQQTQLRSPSEFVAGRLPGSRALKHSAMLVRNLSIPNQDNVCVCYLYWWGSNMRRGRRS